MSYDIRSQDSDHTVQLHNLLPSSMTPKEHINAKVMTPVIFRGLLDFTHYTYTSYPLTLRQSMPTSLPTIQNLYELKILSEVT